MAVGEGLRFEDEIWSVDLEVCASEVVGGVSDCLAPQTLQGQMVKENGRDPLYGVLKNGCAMRCCGQHPSDERFICLHVRLHLS